MTTAARLTALVTAVGLAAGGCGMLQSWSKRREARALEESIRQDREALGKMSRPELERAERQSRERAIDQYEKILDEYADVGREEMDEALYLLGRLYFDRETREFEKNQDAYERARQEAEAAGRPAPSEPLPRYPSARAVYERLLRDFPGSSFREDALYDLAYIRSEEGDVDEAMELFRTLVRESPRSRYAPEVHFRLAEHAFETYELSAAEEHYEAVLKFGYTEFTEKTLFKLGWVYYNLDRYDEAKRVLADLLQREVETIEEEGGEYAPAPFLLFPGPRRAGLEKAREPRGDLYEETLEIIARVYSESGGADALASFLRARRKGNEAPPYAAPLMHRLALVYDERSNFTAAEETYQRLLEEFPTFRKAPEVENELVELLLEQGKSEAAARVRERMIDRYDQGTAWARANPEEEIRDVALEEARKGLEWAIAFFHAKGLGQGKEAKDPEERTGEENRELLDDVELDRDEAPKEDPEALAHAVELYEKYLSRFPEGEESYEKRFRYGQALFAAERYGDAAEVFRQVSFDESFDELRETAAFSRILSVEKAAQAQSEPLARPVIDRLVTAYEDYMALNPDSERNPALLFKEGQLYFDAELYPQAIAAFEREARNHPETDFAAEAHDLIAQAHFRLEEYAAAEQWAEKALQFTDSGEALERRADDVRNLYALTMFRQGEGADEENRFDEARRHYLRLVERLPGHDVAPQALYNAASATARAGSADRAAELFERVLAEYPATDLAPDAAVRLADYYKEQPDGTAEIIRVYERVADHHGDTPKGEEFLFLAGNLAIREDRPAEARRLFTKLLDRYPSDGTDLRGDRNVAALYHLGATAFEAGDRERGRSYLERFLDRQRPTEDVFGSGKRSYEFARARSQVLLGDLEARQYESVRIVPPVAESLARKETLLERVVSRYEPAVASGLSPVATRASFAIGQAYEQFAQAIREAPRPGGLTPEETAEYEQLLESHVRPYLLKAIDSYRSVVRASRKGSIDDEWVARCRERMGELAPRVFARTPMPGYVRLPEPSSSPPTVLATWNGRSVEAGSGPGFFGSIFADDSERRRGAFADGLAAVSEPSPDWNEALTAFRKANGAPESTYNAAIALIRQGKEREARLELEPLIRQDPPFLPALALAARLAERANRTDEAVGILRKATGVAGAGVGPWLALGRLLEETDRPEEALEAWRGALEVDRDHPEARLAVERLAEPPDPERLASLVPQLRGEPEKLVSLGILAAEVDRPELALRAFTAAREALGDDRSARATVVANQALAALEAGELGRASAFLQEGQELAPDSATTQNVAGLLRMRKGDFEAAETSFRTAVTADPAYGPPLVNLGILQELYLAEPDDAVESYRKYLARSSENAGRVQSWIEEIRKGARQRG